MTVEDVLRVSRRVFSPRWPNLSYIGPDGDGDALRERLKLPYSCEMHPERER